jgi:phospholipase C
MGASRRVAPSLALAVLLAGGIGATIAAPGASATSSAPPVAVLTAASTKDDINTIQHVVVIMQENRSFDQYFGMYPGVDGFTLDAAGQPTNCLPDPETAAARPCTTTRPTCSAADLTARRRRRATSTVD